MPTVTSPSPRVSASSLYVYRQTPPPWSATESTVTPVTVTSAGSIVAGLTPMPSPSVQRTSTYPASTLMMLAGTGETISAAGLLISMMSVLT